MKNNISAALVIVGLSLSAAYAADNMQKNDAKKTDTMKKSDAQKSSDMMLKTSTAVVMPATELKWVDAPEVQGMDVKGMKMAVVDGDPKKGPFHAFHKFPAGFEAPLHHHSADHYATVVSGNVTLTVDGKDYKLAPGSYFEFLSKQKHATKCDSGSECVMSMDCRGAWDVVPEKAATR